MRITGMDAAAVVPGRLSGLQGTSNGESQVTQKIKTGDNNMPQPGNTGETRNIPVNEGAVADAVDKMNKMFEGTNRKFEFTVHDKINSIMIRIIDSETGQIIREVPPKKILDMVANLMELAGLLVDERR